MTPHKRTSIYITTVFGFIYVMANASYLPATAAIVVRGIAILGALGLLLATPGPDRPDPAGVGFSRSYWQIVAGEVIVGLVGLAVLNSVFALHDASIAWISLVVGVHFFGFYVIWHFPIMIWIGAAITLCGAVGLLVAVVGLPAAIVAIAGGILPGGVLLAGGYWSALHRQSGTVARNG
jgi:hypothetical protein